jgi:tRNA-uridine 2-sulfurtransferase
VGSVLAAMSGGVDSSVAAALLLEQGHDVVGVTLKLWGGRSDRGCCSVSDVDDARRVAQQLGIDHLVFGFADDFEARVVQPFVDAHAAGLTPNPCVECNRHLKFDRLLRRAEQLGFDAVATGHHARVSRGPDGFRLGRGADRSKDQSYVLHMLGQDALARTRLPVGHLTKAEVRERAGVLGLRTAAKPDSQDVCFITATGGREAFLGERIPLHPGRVVDVDGRRVGEVAAVELVTIGQRKRLGLAGGGDRRFVVDVDIESATVTVGSPDHLLVDEQVVDGCTWVGEPAAGEVLVQCSAHGEPRPARVVPLGDGAVTVVWARPERAVAAGQSVVLYDPTDRWVLGGGVARPRAAASART